MTTTIKISQLPNISNVAGNTLLPVVSNTGTLLTNKATVQQVGNFILSQAGNGLTQAAISTLAQSVTNSAQPNITSVGVLTNLTTSGNILALNINGGNLVTANYLHGTLTTANQPYITEVGNLVSLTVEGQTNLGSVGNLTIEGGSAGDVLTTDGAGNLSWAAVSGNGTYGNSNVANYLPTYNGNIGKLSFQDANTLAVITGRNGAFLKLYGPDDTIFGCDQGNAAVWSNGSIEIRTGINGINDKIWTFDNTGNLNLPGNTFAVKYANGTLVPISNGSTYSNSNVAAYLPTYTGNVSANWILANNLSGNGSSLHHISGANVTGAVANAEFSNTIAVEAVNNNFSYHVVLTTGPGDTTLHNDSDDSFQYNPADGILTVTRVDTQYLEVSGSVLTNLVPFDSLPLSLGSNTNPWQDLYLSNSTIYLGDATISANGNSIVVDSIVSNTITIAGNVGNVGNIAVLNLNGNANSVLAGDGNWVAQGGGGGLPLANGNSIIDIATVDGNITLDANGNVFTFATDGNLTTPSNLVIGPGPGGGSSLLQYDAALQIVGEGSNGIVLMGWAANQSAPDSIAVIGMNTPYANGAANVLIAAGNNATTVNYWNFDNTGNLTLPGNTFAVNYANGAQVPLGNLGNLEVTGTTIGIANGASETSIVVGNGPAGLTMNQDSNNPAYLKLSANTTGSSTFYESSDYTSGSYTNDGGSGGTITLTGATNIETFLNTLNFPGTIVSLQINGTDTVPYTGSSYGGGTVQLSTSTPPTVDPTVVTSIRFNIVYVNQFVLDDDEGNFGIYIGRENFDIESGRDINITAGDDLRLESNDIFSLTNNDGGISFTTNANGAAQYWTFEFTGQTLFPVLTTTRGDVSSGTLTGPTLCMATPSYQELVITTPDGDGAVASSQRLVINPGKGADNTSGEGGDIYLWAGRGGSGVDGDVSAGSGGDVKVRGGYGPLDADGGYIRMEGGEAFRNGAGGFVEIYGGVSGNGIGGPLLFEGGQGGSNGGNVNITGGQGLTQHGGNINITGGVSGNSSNEHGNINLTSSASSWVFGNDGNLTLPSNTFAVNYANGTQVSLGSAALGNLTVDDITLQGNGSSLNLSAGPDFTANLAYLQVRSGDFPSHIHFDTGNNDAYDQYFGNDSKYLKLGLGIAGNVSIGTYQDGGVGQLEWIFDSNGNLVLAGGNSVIQSIANSSLDPVNPNVSTMVLTPDQGYSSQSLVLDPTAPGHIHLRAPGANIDEPYANIFLGGEDSSFEVGYYTGNAAPNLFIHSGNNTWTFDNTGNLSVPSNILVSGLASPAPYINGFDSITLVGTGTVVSASSGNILTNEVTGTKFNFLNGLYTATLTGSGATANYSLNLPANAGTNGQVLSTDGTGNLSWISAGSSYGDSNVATFLGSYGSNTISTTGNIAVGAVTATGKIGYASGGTVTQTGTGQGVTLNQLTGAITLAKSSWTAGDLEVFVVQCNKVAADDYILAQISGTYSTYFMVSAYYFTGTSFYINVRALDTISSTPIVKFFIMKAPTA